MARRPPNLIPTQPAVKRYNPAHDFYQTPFWRAQRLAVKERDGWQCTRPDCRTPGRGRGRRLVVNHIIPRGQPGSTDDLSNLETVCAACDNRGHREKGHCTQAE